MGRTRGVLGRHPPPRDHRREDRIRAHVLLCWLVLLLIRIAEIATGETWRSLAWELNKLHLGRFVGPAGEVHQNCSSGACSANASPVSPGAIASRPTRRPLIPFDAVASLT